MRTLPLLLLAACAAKAPPTPPVPVPAGTWRVDAADTITAPAALPELMGGYFDAHVLVSVTGEGGPALLVDSADADGAPMGCGLTTRLPLTPAVDGTFTASAKAVPLVGEDDVPFTLRGARIDGAVSATGLSIVSITGTLDSGAFVGLLGSDDRGALCTMAKERIPCGPCPDGGETCWEVSLAPALIPAPALQARTAAEVCAEPACADRPWCAGGGS